MIPVPDRVGSSAMGRCRVLFTRPRGGSTSDDVAKRIHQLGGEVRKTNSPLGPPRRPIAIARGILLTTSHSDYPLPTEFREYITCI
jgi:hypothetical protein